MRPSRNDISIKSAQQHFAEPASSSATEKLAAGAGERPPVGGLDAERAKRSSGGETTRAARRPEVYIARD